MADQFTLEEATTMVRSVVVLSQSFQGFVMPDGIKKELERAGALKRNNDESGAIKILVKINADVRKIIAVFFRNSPKFFEKKLTQLYDLNYHDDILNTLEDQVDKIDGASRTGELIDLEEASEIYGEMHRLLVWAREEMDRRTSKKGASKPQGAQAIDSLIDMI
ncbi:MAG: hypothetical protein KBC81_00265 [Candidatus Pacebacteria bacterium]|nr:hypothetical protein [Candidatus Paceibacterota bacterium]